jgi:phage tail sheath protein FI
MRPGVNIAIRDAPPMRAAATDTGVWFVSGLAEKGPTTSSQLITSISEYTRYFGSKVSYGNLYDVLDVFFREGGTTAYVTRIVGPAAVTAFKVLNDSVPAATLRVEANSPGAWGNSLLIAVLTGDAGGEFKLQVSHSTLGILETSPSLVDKQAAFDWALNSSYIKLVDQASLNDPAVAAASALTTGADDQAGINDASWTASLTRFSRDLGPGQVSFPGRTTDPAYESLILHAAGNNRVALLDSANTNVKATLLAAVTGVYGTNSKWAAMFGPWLRVPGAIPNTIRTIPPSPVVAGLIARTDALGSPNTPAAGENGQPRFAIDLSVAQVSDADLQELNTAGFNNIIMKYGGVRVYGWRSLAKPETEPNWINFGNSRLIMEIAALSDNIAESYLFDEIDGQGRKINEFGAALTGMLMPYWNIGSLYGATPEQAFLVDVGPTVNTPTTIANLELRAVIGLRPSPFAEMVTIEIVKTPITQAI